MKNLKFLLLAFTLVLVSCGGGGGGEPPRTTAPTTTFPLRAANKSYIQAPHFYTHNLSGTCGGWATSNTSATTPTVYAGKTALVSAGTMRMTIDSCSAARADLVPLLPKPGTTVSTTQMFYDNDYRLIAAQVSGLGIINLPNTSQLPETVKVGDVVVVASTPQLTVSYAVESETETTALIKTTIQAFISGETISGIETHRITTDGVLTLVRTEIFLQPTGFTFVLTPK